MARPIPDLDPMEANEVAQDDDILIDDVSADETKRIQVGKLLGLPVIGWTATGQSWSYSSWNGTTKRGVVTVPSDATAKYNAGMLVRLTQATGGTKYFVIISVTSTTLTIKALSTETLNNEAITSPMYSTEMSPYGAPAATVGAAKRTEVVKAGSFPITSTGNKVITGLGFKPKIVEFFDQYSGGSNYAGMGFMTADYQCAKAQGSRAGQADTEESFFSESYCFYSMTISGSASIRGRLARVTFDDDGFTVNCTVADPTYGVTYKAYA